MVLPIYSEQYLALTISASVAKAAPINVSMVCGSIQSSLSMNEIYSPLTFSSPRFLAEARPLLSV